MEKKVYYKFSDGFDVSNVVMTLGACMNWIEGESNAPDHSDKEYTLIPVLMTEEEFNNLPEACI